MALEVSSNIETPWIYVANFSKHIIKQKSIILIQYNVRLTIFLNTNSKE